MINALHVWHLYLSNYLKWVWYMILPFISYREVEANSLKMKCLISRLVKIKGLASFFFTFYGRVFFGWLCGSECRDAKQRS